MVDERIGGLLRTVGPRRVFWAGAMRTSENPPSGQLVDKGPKSGAAARPRLVGVYDDGVPPAFLSPVEGFVRLGEQTLGVVPRLPPNHTPTAGQERIFALR